MFKLLPDFHGGFLLVEDYGGALAGDLALSTMIACIIVLPSFVLLQSPEGFSIALGCFCLGFFFLFLNGTFLEFLVPLSLPIFTYGLISLCNGLLACCSGTLLIFMYLIIAVPLLFGNALLWGAAAGDIGAGFGVLLSIPMWFSCCNSTMEEATGAFNFFILKGIWLVAAATCLFMAGRLILRLLKNEGKTLLKNSQSWLAGFAGGLVCLFGAFLLSSMVNGWISAALLLTGCMVLFGFGSALLSSLLGEKHEIVLGMISLLLLGATACFFEYGTPTVRDMIMPELISMLSMLPILIGLGHWMASLAAFTSPLVSSGIDAIVRLVTGFLEHPQGLEITCNAILAMLLTMSTLIWTIGASSSGKVEKYIHKLLF